MEYHGVYMIFNLLYLAWQIKDDSTVKIDDLRNAFYEYEYLINDNNGVTEKLDFDSELENLCTSFTCIFEISDDEISLVDEDFNDLYDAIKDFLDDKPTEIDEYMIDSISNYSIYKALKLDPPYEETRNIFETNKNIIIFYQLLAKLVSENKDTTAIRKMISYYKSLLKEFFRNIDNRTYMKIKLCLGSYNDVLLEAKPEPNINYSWHIALLSDNPRLKNALAYDKIFLYIDEEKENQESEKDEAIESKDLVLTSFNKNANEENPIKEMTFINDEVVYFLTFFIIHLNNYIKEVDNNLIKKELLERMFLLLGTGELEDIEDEYLKEGSLDSHPLPTYIKELFSPASFSFLIGNFEELLSFIRISDDILMPQNISKMIISLLLLKCYLDLSINEEIKKELIAEITNPDYYKNPKYQYISDYIDTIIFNKTSPNRNRKKKEG